MDLGRRTKGGKLLHSKACTAAFGRFDKRCPRCLELVHGAPARPGWQKKPNPQQRSLNF
jgi:hypothetical protein